MSHAQGGSRPTGHRPLPTPPTRPLPSSSSLDTNGAWCPMPIPSPAPSPGLSPSPFRAPPPPPPLPGATPSPSEMMASSRIALYQNTSTRPQPLPNLSLENAPPPAAPPEPKATANIPTTRPRVEVPRHPIPSGIMSAPNLISQFQLPAIDVTSQPQHWVSSGGRGGPIMSAPPIEFNFSAAQGAKQEWSDDVLEVLAKLGQGAGGSVWKVRDRRNGRVMARKTITTGNVPVGQLLRELRFSELFHPNLIDCYGAYTSPLDWDESSNYPPEIHILMELCEGGALDAIARQMKAHHNNTRIGEKIIARLTEDVLKGLDYMHSNKMMHRDVKPSNILVTGSGVAKLCDFGVSGDLEASLAITFTGTSWYMAPERITGRPYSIRADVWSTGLTFLELAQNRPAYPPQLGPSELLEYIVNGKVPELDDEPGDENGNGATHWSEGMKSFIKQCLRIDAETRPTPRQMLQHPWIQESMTHELDMAKWIREVWGWESTVIGSSLTASEIAAALVSHGCVDLTQQLDMSSCSAVPVSTGGFSDVYSGGLVNGTHVAIKVPRAQAIHDRSGKQLKHAAKELHTWSKCEHPNVQQLLGLVQFRGQIGMVSQWIEHGSIRRHLDLRPNANRRQLCYGICDGLAYLHSNGIIHGDLKGANVLVSYDGTPLLTDFGTSMLSNQSLKFTKTSEKFNVSCRWTAPEVLEGGVSLSYSADIFSLGMTLLETITGDVPYKNLKDPAVYAAILIKKQIPARPEEHLLTSDEHDNLLWSLLEQCWNFEPEHRPGADQVRDKMLKIVKMASPVDMPIPITF